MPRLTRPREPDVAGLLSALAAELEAGQALEAALSEACRGLDPVPCPQALSAARAGANVAAALRADARSSGQSGLRALAACWEVASRSGSGLSASVRRLAEAQRASQAARGELLAELATVRSSTRLLAGLPLLGVTMGVLLGANPVGWLLSGPVGLLVLVGGLLFEGAGLLWMHRIVARVHAAIP